MPAIVTDVHVAWSVRLSHPCILLKLLDRMRNEMAFDTDTRVASVKMYWTEGSVPPRTVKKWGD